MTEVVDHIEKLSATPYAERVHSRTQTAERAQQDAEETVEREMKAFWKTLLHDVLDRWSHELKVTEWPSGRSDERYRRVLEERLVRQLEEAGAVRICTVNVQVYYTKILRRPALRIRFSRSVRNLDGVRRRLSKGDPLGRPLLFLEKYFTGNSIFGAKHASIFCYF